MMEAANWMPTPANSEADEPAARCLFHRAVRLDGPPPGALLIAGRNLALVKFFASDSEAQTEDVPKICAVLASVGSITTSL